MRKLILLIIQQFQFILRNELLSICIYDLVGGMLFGWSVAGILARESRNAPLELIVHLDKTTIFF